MNHPRTPSESVSALADGALRGEAFARTLDGLANDPEAQACWSRYQLIGDALQQGDRACAPADPAFVERLRARLSQEPQMPHSAAQVVDARSAVVPVAVPVEVPGPRRSAANAEGFRWKMAAGFASVAAAAAIGWSILGPGPLSGSGRGPALAEASGAAGTPVAVRQFAQDRGAQAPSIVSGAGQVMLRDARLDELLAAHREAGGGAGLQSPGSFVRNASFEVVDPGNAGR